MVKTVFGKANAWVSMPDGPPVYVGLGSPWRVDDPVVKRWPDMFSEESPITHASQPLTPGPVR